MNYSVVVPLAVLLIAVTLASAWLYLSLRRLRSRYAPIINLDVELGRLSDELVRMKRERQEFSSENERQRTQLTQEYQRGRVTYENLKREISLLEENLEDISFGLYKPHYNFETSEQYKQRLEALRDRERLLIRGGLAATCPVKWTVGGSQKEGERMAKQNTKLLLRAFNGECDAALAKVSWNNIVQMEERIHKSCEAINQLGTVMKVTIAQDYLRLKVDELRLTHEYEEKRHQEQEEQRRIRQQIREEEKVQREAAKVREEAEREESRFQKALEKARLEASHAAGEQLQEINDKMRSLEAQLEEARKQKERAISRAELTKSGNVYVISNIGSFGEDVYKVGMTRRLEPMERIEELGDASVPFPFDVHAMIYSENAPELESSMHELLNDRRINLANPRKEFFRVSLDQIERFANSKGLKVEFTKLAEAKEYRETLAARKADVPVSVQAQEQYPASLFANSDRVGS